MSKVEIIAELGSCHMGKLTRIREAIDKVKELNLYALKLQLFPNESKYTDPGNIWLHPQWFSDAFTYAKQQGVILSASVFDEYSLDFLLTFKPEFVKLAYSKKDKADLNKYQNWAEKIYNAGSELIVSCDVMSDHLVDPRATKLYCVPLYPVPYELSFDGLFPRFAGFSDHTLGIRQTQRAVDAGAIVIEKHVKLGYSDELCPDARFAVNIEDLGKLHVLRNG